MKISRKRVGLIVSTIAAAMLGLIFLLSWLMKESIQLREQTFDDNVAGALSNMVEGIETRRAYQIIIGFEAESIGDSLSITANFNNAMPNDSLIKHMFMSNGDTVQVCDTLIGGAFFHDVAAISTLDTILLIDSGNYQKSESSFVKIIKSNDSITSYHSIQTGIIDGSSPDQIKFIERLLNRMWKTDDARLENRLDSALIDSTLDEAFKNVGISLPYSYGVGNIDDDSLILSTSDQYEKILGSEYKVELFPYDIATPGAMLSVYFADRDIFIWKQVVPILVTVAILMTIIVGTFVYTIRIIIDQKRSAQLMTDFVNNMTHEFKTPISTISLAAEAIKREDQIVDKVQVSQFAGMILDENNRMRRQTDKILQMAALEENDKTLKSDRLDLHKIISDAVIHIRLLVNNREGSIACELKAGDYFISGDKVHVSGIIYNLLDNAIKYSPDKPEISISTINANNGIYIRVIDKGIGIKPDDIKQVFNKYFRVSTGNRHDVKGFGLGLSYVKLITEAHGGRIDIKSEYGHGTRVEIFLPIENNNE